MHWNHRVIKTDIEFESDGEIVKESYFQFAEVYYNSKTNEPYAHCEPHMTGDTIEELQGMVERLSKALKQPVLAEEDFTGTYDGEEDED